jgi:capsular polysaccharide export protein
MISEGLLYFAGKRILLLQGPVGPFFRSLAKDLIGSGASVWKVNFNGGDWLFYPSGGIAFRKALADWPLFLERLLDQHAIDTIMLFGDCRPIHRLARKSAEHRKIDIWVFEEGYIRPNYVTFEHSGVNGNSKISAHGKMGSGRSFSQSPPSFKVNHAFWLSVLWACLYYVGASIGKPFFRKYRHHRPLNILEAGPWIRGAWRKVFYAVKERGVLEKLTGALSQKYYLVPLQVHNDSQVSAHSEFDSVDAFIRKVLNSFADYAPKDSFLVFKHHPMDRAYLDYTRLLQALSKERGLGDRVIYVHDLHLPSLLKHAIGVVVINSTVGFSSLYYNTPVKVCGRAVYDLERLTFQGSLDEFWKTSRNIVVDRGLFNWFRNYIVDTTQLNGSFYSRLPQSDSCSGLIWNYNGNRNLHRTSLNTAVIPLRSKDTPTYSSKEESP